MTTIQDKTGVIYLLLEDRLLQHTTNFPHYLLRGTVESLFTRREGRVNVPRENTGPLRNAHFLCTWYSMHVGCVDFGFFTTQIIRRWAFDNSGGYPHSDNRDG